MQPIRCQGGYAVPIKEGKMEIVAIHAPANDITSISRLKIVDNASGQVLPETQDTDKIVTEIKRIGNLEGNVSQMLPETIKVVNGVNITYAENMVPGSILVYVR
jgi:hypothetical protein